MGYLTGSGLSTGNPYQPITPHQQELSATDQAPRQMLGITKNTDDMVFTTFGQTQYGPDKRDLYKSTSSNPTLERPLNTFRVGTGVVDQPGLEWQQNYQNLINMLPDDTRDFLKEELAYPPEQQDPWALALNDILLSTAVVLTHFEGAVSGMSLESVQTGALINGLMPLSALNTSNLSGNEIVNSTQENLNTVGRNDPSFDNTTLVNNTINGFVATLGSIIADIKANGVTANSQTALANLANQTDGFLSQANMLLSSGNLGTLLVTLSLISLISGANGLPNASAGLALALSAGTIGLDNTTVGQLASSIASGLQALALPESGAGEKQLLTDLVALSIGLGAGIAFATSPDGTPTAIDSFKQELGIALALSAAIPQTIFGEAASALGADSNGQSVISAALTAITLMVANFIWTPKNTEETYRLPSRTSEEVRSSLQTIADAITDAVHSGRLSSASEPVSAALYHASASLQDEDYGTFFSILSTGLSQLGISLENLGIDLGSFGEIASTANTALDPSNANVPTQTITA